MFETEKHRNQLLNIKVNGSPCAQKAVSNILCIVLSTNCHLISVSLVCQGSAGWPVAQV